ncbi:MAG: LysR family transcriptional regulator [Parvularculaceae bacterium]|nr:LysR family transcriptional regulator [Parvularculaceae bacterium]
MAKFEKIDLNLLVAFDALVIERHVSRAATRLNVSQPALSHSLKRLRELFNDEILVRCGGSMVLTPRAQALHEEIAPALASLRVALDGPAVFDPTTTQRVISIGIQESSALQILPAVLATLEEEAPGLGIACAQYSPEESVRRARDGELDLLIGYYATPLPKGLVGRTLSSLQSYFAVADRGNRHFKRGRISRKDYLALPHIAVSMNGTVGSNIDTALEDLGLKRNIRVIAPNFSVVPALVRGTQMIGHCGRLLVDQLTYRDELILFEPPIPLATSNLRALWRRSASPDPAVLWLVDQIRAITALSDVAEAASQC